jgi:D-sedoheptulose 7-phosphate isomerase
MRTFTQQYLSETSRLLEQLDPAAIEKLAEELAAVREQGGRLFILGVGGSAGHASHAVNDFRKLCSIEAYAPTDNVPELTARVNDEGWESCLANWLHVSRLRAPDALLIFSVGGGSRAKNVSVNLVWAIELARLVGAKVFGIVGRDGGFTAACADACVVVPPLFPERVTPHTEGLCAVLWHLLVSHPLLQKAPTCWEAIVDQAVAPPLSAEKMGVQAVLPGGTP